MVLIQSYDPYVYIQRVVQVPSTINAGSEDCLAVGLDPLCVTILKL